MIRANLLPRSREHVRLFGINVDTEYLRTAGLGLFLVLLIGGATLGVETLRLHRIGGDADAAEVTLASNDARRMEAQRVAFDVARLEATGRRAADLHRSGNDVARQIARIGNAIPAAVYLDTLTTDRDTVQLRGQSNSLDRIGETMTALGRAFPALRASLGDVNDKTSAGLDALSFTALVQPQSAVRPALVPHHAAPADLAR